MAAEFEAVGAGQHHVQKEQSRHLAHGFGQHRMAADKTLHLEPGGLQIVGDKAGNVLIIFNNKNDWMEGVGTRIAPGAVVGFGWQMHFRVGGPSLAHDRQPI